MAGSLLSWFLQKEAKTVCVIDDGADVTPSKVAAGIINPVTGRRYHTTWKADELHPFAWKTYSEIGQQFSTSYIFEKSIIEFFPTPDARNLFVDRVHAGNAFLGAYPDQNRFNDFLHYDFGCGEIRPVYCTSLSLLLADVRKGLADAGALLTESFRHEELQITDEGVRYGDITASKLIFCEGPSGAENPWFRLLPFALNKGEALVIECRDLPAGHLYKRGITIAPLAVHGTFWVGSSYAWDGLDSGATDAFYQRITSALSGMLKVPYKVLFHKAAVRPATVERRPFVGLHPLYPQLGIFNGFGSKGTSLAPYFAQQLANHLLHGAPITPEADVQRFRKLLSK